MTLWLFAAGMSVMAYLLYATLKGELFPPQLDFNLSHQPQGHVSLLYELWYQIHRNQGTLFNHSSYLYADVAAQGHVPAGGRDSRPCWSACTWGGATRERNPSLLVAGTLALEIAFYLARGSVILDFYVIPLIPLFALCIGLVADRALKALPVPVARVAVTVIPALAAALLLLPSGGYLLTHDSQTGQLQADDVVLPAADLPAARADRLDPARISRPPPGSSPMTISGWRCTTATPPTRTTSRTSKPPPTPRFGQGYSAGTGRTSITSCCPTA